MTKNNELLVFGYHFLKNLTPFLADEIVQNTSMSALERVQGCLPSYLGIL